MSKKAQQPKTWRDLTTPQGTKRRKRPLSLRAKLRSFGTKLRIIFFVLLSICLVLGAYTLYKNSYFEEIFSVKSESIKRVEFKTDGLTTSKWLNAYLAIPKDTKLAELNIFEIKRNLESLGQIRTASVERVYPDVLRITLTEQKPFMKLFTEVSGMPKMYIMTSDGEFFEPSCVPPEMIDSMPKLEGFTPIFNGRVPNNYKSASKLASFMSSAYEFMPNESRNWHRIDVSDFDRLTLPLLKVITDSDIEIIFAPRDYKKQFDRLEYILRYQKENPLTIIKRIDLSIKGWAPVKIKNSK